MTWVIYEIDLVRQWKIWGHYSAMVELQILPWCKENCNGHFTHAESGYLWRFEKLEDAVAFRLRWDEPGY
jgi:hypothetical protein